MITYLRKILFNLIIWGSISLISILHPPMHVSGMDLDEIKKSGALRHLGVPYSKFVTGSGNGLDVDMVKLFARHLDVRYEYVKTSWKDVIGDLTGKYVVPRGDNIEILGDVPVRGDIIANGLTILPWRQKIVNFSTPTFPTQVWVVALSDSKLTPIEPSGDTDKDIAAVKKMLEGYAILGVANTCLDPALYGIKETGAKVLLFDKDINELVPAIIKRDAEATLLDMPDYLIAMEKWPTRIKVIGPVSPMQNMGYAFSKTSPQLLNAFNRFFALCKKDGTYLRLVNNYYPAVYSSYPEFFKID